MDIAFLLPIGGITDWLGPLAVGVVALVVLMAWTKVAIRDGIKGALPEHVRHLEEIGQTAQDIVEQLGKLDTALKAENRAGYRLSVVQTLFGTLIGLVGGFANDWIDKGGIGRILAALGIGLLLVLAGPPLTIGLYNTLRKSPMQAPGGEEGISDEAGERRQSTSRI